MANRVLNHLPDVLRVYKEFQEIDKIESPIIEYLWEQIENLIKDQFVLTLTDVGAKRNEKMLNISVPATDSLETRRFRILSRYQEQAPYSYRVLEQLLDSLLGEGEYVMTRDTAAKSIAVKIELTVKGEFDTVVNMMERVTPQNMILTVELRYNQYSKLSNYTHAQLAAFTYKQLREEVLD